MERFEILAIFTRALMLTQITSAYVLYVLGFTEFPPVRKGHFLVPQHCYIIINLLQIILITLFFES